MTPEERIDAALDSILRIIGTPVEEYKEFPESLQEMREAMKKIMKDSFNDGIASTLGVREVFNK